MGELDDQLRRLGEARAAEVPATDAARVMAAPRRPRQIAWWLSAAAAIAVLAGLGALLLRGDDDAAEGDVADSTTSTTTTTTTAPPTTTLPDVRNVGSGAFGVEFDIPAEWSTAGRSNSWEGDDGYVTLAARADVAGLDDLAEQVADHPLASFGTDPTIEAIDVGGTSARLILPSEDAAARPRFGQVLVPSPRPIELGPDTFDWLVIEADVDHIRAIAASLVWIEESGPPPTGDLSPDDRYDAVAATPMGVVLRDADDPLELDRIVFEPIALAFLINQESGPTLVYQLAEPGDVYPPRRDGFIHILTPDGEREIRSTDLIMLHDAALLDGQSTVLATVRTGGAAPETTDVRLLLIDMDSGERTDLGSFGGWESGVSDARLTDGSIVLLRSAEGFSWIEVIEYDGTSRWESEQVFDMSRSIDVGRETVYDVRPTFTDDFDPVFGYTGLDIRTGEVVGDWSYELEPQDGLEIPAGFCHRISNRFGSFFCDQSTGPPVRIDLEFRWISAEEGFTDGVVTRPAESVSTRLPEQHPCGRGYSSFPHDIWAPELVDVGPEQLAVTRFATGDTPSDESAFTSGDIVGIQAQVGEWFTNRLDLPGLPSDRLGDITFEPWEDTVADGEAPFLVSLEGEGAAIVAYDGCVLSQVGWIDY